MSNLMPQRTPSIAASGACSSAQTIGLADGAIRRFHSKRCIDLVGAGLTLLTIAPIVLLMMVVLYALQGRPIFIAHRRVGRGGKPFHCLKFRSMVADADAVLKRHLDENAEARAEWAASRKLKRDPRITPLGHLIRKSSVDELPQLLNVLRGDMSLVGPRPIVEAEITSYGHHFQYYCTVRPGLTGRWQVSGRNNVSYSDRVQMDVAYIESISLFNDIVILLRTIPAVLVARRSC